MADERDPYARAHGTAVALRTYARNAAEGKVPPLDPNKVAKLADQIAKAIAEIQEPRA